MANISKVKLPNGSVYTISDTNAVHINGDETIYGNKTFDADAYFKTYVSYEGQVEFYNDAIFQSDCTPLVYNYLQINGDDDVDPIDSSEPDWSDIDTEYHNTGIRMRNADGSEFHEYVFPNRSGTFGLEIEIDDLTSL